jgi:6,7-dimethyl-8-ribityllumazine synthase
MLKKIAKRSQSTGGSFAIVAAKYNSEYTNALVESAQAELKSSRASRIQVIRVPGSFEVPVVAAKLARGKKFDAIICFGAILRGQTTHAQQIADAVSQGLMQIQVETGVPVIHGVLLFENEHQARERCFGVEHNRGLEAARVALEMAAVMKDVAGRP